MTMTILGSIATSLLEVDARVQGGVVLRQESHRAFVENKNKKLQNFRSFFCNQNSQSASMGKAATGYDLSLSLPAPAWRRAARFSLPAPASCRATLAPVGRSTS